MIWHCAILWSIYLVPIGSELSNMKGSNWIMGVNNSVPTISTPEIDSRQSEEITEAHDSMSTTSANIFILDNDSGFSENRNGCRGEFNISACQDSVPSQGVMTTLTFVILQRVTISFLFLFYILAIYVNAINIIVYKKKSFEAHSKEYILALSVVDVLANCLGLSLIISISTSPSLSDYVRVSVNFVVISFRRFSNCVMCLISMERCISLLRIMHASDNAIARYPHHLMVVLFVTVFAFGWVDVYNVIDKQSKGETEVILSLISKVTFVYLMLALIVCINIVTAISVYRQGKKRLTLGTSVNEQEIRQKQDGANRILLTLTFVYVILALPNTTVVILRDISKTINPFGKERFLYLTLIRLGGVTDTLMNMSDFFVFLSLNKRYRTVARGVILNCFCWFCRCHTRRLPSNLSTDLTVREESKEFSGSKSTDLEAAVSLHL